MELERSVERRFQARDLNALGVREMKIMVHLAEEILDREKQLVPSGLRLEAVHLGQVGRLGSELLIMGGQDTGPVAGSQRLSGWLPSLRRAVSPPLLRVGSCGLF